MKTLTARYFKETGTIALYNEYSRLVEFPVDQRELWQLPPLATWKTTSYGCEQTFEWKPVYKGI